MRVAGRELTKYTIALLVIVLVGAFLRLYHIGAQSLGADDTWSVWVSKLSLHDIVQTTAADVHPPLYYFLLHYWMAYFGTSELAVKLPSVRARLASRDRAQLWLREPEGPAGTAVPATLRGVPQPVLRGPARLRPSVKRAAWQSATTGLQKVLSPC